MTRRDKFAVHLTGCDPALYLRWRMIWRLQGKNEGSEKMSDGLFGSGLKGSDAVVL